MTTYNNTRYRAVPPTDPRTLGDLVSELTRNAGLLARQEVQLAKVEMQAKAEKATGDVITIAAGATLANAALLALVAAAILGLSLYVTTWLAALIVAAVVGFIAAILIATGVSALKNIDPVPEQTVDSLREDKEWLTRQMN